MAAIDLSNAASGGGGGGGNLQLASGASMSSTLRAVTDTSNVASPLELSTTLVKITSTLRITTNDNPYVDAEDGSGNNRFTIGRDGSSQQVNVDFASNPTGSTTIVGAVRTYTDGTNLSEVMTFREDGNVGFGTTTPTNAVSIERTTGNSVLSVQGNAGTFISVSRFSDNVVRPRYELYKSRGTIAAPLVVQTGDDIGSVDFNGYDGSANQRVGILYVNAESVAGSTITPQMAFGLGTSAGTNTYKMVIKNDGNITIGNDLNTLGARLGIKGSGSTSATTSLLVQNSAGTQIFKVSDDASFTFAGGGTADFQGNVSLRGINDSGNAALNLRFIVTGATKSFLINADYSNTNAPSAMLEVQSTTKGFLPPRMTNAQKNAIASPAEGLIVHDTTNNGVAYYDGTTWGYLSGAKQTLTGSGGTLNIPFRNGNIVDLALNASTTLTFASHVVGTYIIEVTQGGGGSNTLTYPASVKWSGGTAPTLTTTVGKTDILTFFHDGTFFYGTYSLNY
jgi:hypothetical protein